jgi:hypothetical protein
VICIYRGGPRDNAWGGRFRRHRLVDTRARKSRLCNQDELDRYFLLKIS